MTEINMKKVDEWVLFIRIIVFEFYRRFGYKCLFLVDYVFACVYLLDNIHVLYCLDKT